MCNKFYGNKLSTVAINGQMVKCLTKSELTDKCYYASKCHQIALRFKSSNDSQDVCEVNFIKMPTVVKEECTEELSR